MTNDLVRGMPAEPLGRWRPGRVLVGVGLGVAGHVIALVGALIAGRTADPGQDFDDLAAVAVTFLGTQALVLLAVVVAGIAWYVRHRRDLAAGLVGGWLLGTIFCVLVISGLVRVS